MFVEYTCSLSWSYFDEISDTQSYKDIKPGKRYKNHLPTPIKTKQKCKVYIRGAGGGYILTLVTILSLDYLLKCPIIPVCLTKVYVCFPEA